MPSASRKSCLISGRETNLAIPVIACTRLALVKRLGGFVIFSTVLLFVARRGCPGASGGIDSDALSFAPSSSSGESSVWDASRARFQPWTKGSLPLAMKRSPATTTSASTWWYSNGANN